MAILEVRCGIGKCLPERNAVRVFFFVVLLVLASGCDNSPQLSDNQIQELERDCEILASSVHVPMKAQVHLPVENLPASLAALHPKAVYIDEEGVYIALQSQFVKESGYFYLLPYSPLSPAASTDPGFERIGTRLYRYRIRG